MATIATLEKSEPVARPSRAKVALSFLFGALIFATIHTQAPLFYSNQNQYLLHGLSEGGLGDLEHDWLANTTDPTPVFSALVAFTDRHLPLWTLHIYYAILLGLYFLAFMGLLEFACGERLTISRWLAAAFVVCLVHAAALRYFSVYALNHDYPWYFQSGVAGQYLLGPVLQPSAFGVLLVVSLYAFAVERPIFASIFAALAVVMHATYAPTAALLVLGYLVVLGRDKRWRLAGIVAGLALLITAPIVLWQLNQFAPTSPDVSAKGQEILVHFRIPHHTLPSKWFSWIAAVQIVWMIAGIAASWRTRLFPVLTIVFLISLALTILQLIVKNDTLALLFPWRSSALLVPVATALLIGRLFQVIAESSAQQERITGFASAAGIAALALAGIAIMHYRLAYRINEDEKPLLEFVRTHRQPGDIYLLPVKAPDTSKGKRGVPSTSFTRPPRQDRDRNLIAVDFQSFRLDTGAAIVVDFKSIPYKDVDVLEWRQRMSDCEWLYKQPDWNVPDARAKLKEYGVTHVIAIANQRLRARTWSKSIKTSRIGSIRFGEIKFVGRDSRGSFTFRARLVPSERES